MGEKQNEAGAGRLRRTTGTNVNAFGPSKVAEHPTLVGVPRFLRVSVSNCDFVGRRQSARPGIGELHYCHTPNDIRHRVPVDAGVRSVPSSKINTPLKRLNFY
jgi:hypothetical protein